MTLKFEDATDCTSRLYYDTRRGEGTMTSRFDDEIDALKRGFRRRDARMERRWNSIHKRMERFEFETKVENSVLRGITVMVLLGIFAFWLFS
jgi:hypothetical protein